MHPDKNKLDKLDRLKDPNWQKAVADMAEYCVERHLEYLQNDYKDAMAIINKVKAKCE